MSISGVQMKLSIRVDPDRWELEAVAEGGTHILKPQPALFPYLPQNENLCMNVAGELKMRVPPHGLFAMADESLCYVVKRFDRLGDGGKLQKETMFQILSATDKYSGSLERVGKTIRAHVANIGLDSIEFFERVLLCFVIGNGDMHLKNWAILISEGSIVSLAPCYDLVSSRIYIPNEDETALTINGKKNKLIRGDFEALGASLEIDPRAAEYSLRKLFTARDPIASMCAVSLLSPELQQELSGLISVRFDRLVAS
ncbi:MAG: HipA domain-containing protein [Anaerolineales bacterium]